MLPAPVTDEERNIIMSLNRRWSITVIMDSLHGIAAPRSVLQDAGYPCTIRQNREASIWRQAAANFAQSKPSQIA